MSRSRWLPALVILLGALAAALMLWSRHAYVPTWDGRIYADCIVRASQHLTDVRGFRCAEHISQSYVGLLALAQRLAPTSPVPMLLANAVLLALSAVALARLLAQVFPDDAHRLERALIVTAFLVHPVALASAVQPGLDYGLLVFSLWALAGGLEGRRWLVVAFGLMLVFTKETGLLVYCVIGALYLWHSRLRALIPGAPYWLGFAAACAALLANAAAGNYLSAFCFAMVLLPLGWRKLQPSRPPTAAILRAALMEWPIALPVVVLFTYMATTAVRNAAAAAAAASTAAVPMVWGGAGAGSLVQTFFRAGIVDAPTLAALALMLVVGFLWIPTTITMLDLGVALGRLRKRLPPRVMAGVSLPALGVVTAALLGEIWFLSRFRTFSNARYYLPVYPLALVVAYGALVRLDVSRRFRTGTLALLAMLLGISALRTVDPVSRALWGTFPVGERSMLQITSLTGECCGYGRDQLVYNLEFTVFDALQSDAYEQLRPDASTTLVLPELGEWYTVGPLDPVTRRRVLRYTDAVQPRIASAHQVYQPRDQVRQAWFVEVPYVSSEYALGRLAEVYEIGAPRWVVRDGYGMAIRGMRLRAQPLGSRVSDAPVAPPLP